MSRFLIIKPSSLGDIIHGLQVAETLRSQLPDMHISWIARDIFAPLVEACTTVDKTFHFERNKGLAGFYRLLKQLREESFDYILDMQGLARSGIMAAFASGSVIIGRSDSREGASFAYDQQIDLPPTGKHAHAIEILLQFCPKFGLPPVLQGKLSFREELIPSLPSDPYLLFFTDSRRPEKEWHGFAELTDTLLKADGSMKIVWGGTQSKSLPKTKSERFINLVGKTNLAQLPALIKNSMLTVSNDSGPMHLAAAMKKPILALFGPTDPNRFGPYPLNASDNHVLLAKDGNIRKLTVTSVQEKIKSILN